ncbi:MAG: FecR domain-containing protein [Armatimonadota bacterium]
MMLHHRRITASAAAVVAALTLACGTPAAEAQSAHITATVLDVQHRVGSSGAWAASTVGVGLPAGSRVRTGKRGRCEVTFPGGTKVRMGPRSDLVITDPAGRRAKVVAGEVFAHVVAGTGGAQIQGATVTAAVRGTDMTMQVRDDGTLPDPDSPEAEEWYLADAGDPGEDVALAGLPTSLLSGVPGQVTPGGNVTVQVWFGRVLVTGPFGSYTLDSGMAGNFGPGAGPTGFNTFNAFPRSFPTGSFQPFFGGWSTGSNVQVTPGSPINSVLRSNQPSSRQQTGSFVDGLPQGSLDIVVQSRATGSGAATAASSPNLAAAALGIAASGQIREQELLGRHFFGPRYQVDLVGLAYDGGALGSGWLRASGIYEDFYGEIGLQALSNFDGDDDLRISELFVVNRRGDTDITLGRQRYLHGPVNNSGLGSLFGVTHFDGIAVDDAGGRLNTTLAWIDEFEAWGTPKVTRSGWLGRASDELSGGVLGASLLLSDDDLGWSVDASMPVFPGAIDMYFELGRDSSDRELSTVGLYSPVLYRSSNVDLFIEYAHRDGYDPMWSGVAYWEAAETWTGLGAVRFSPDSEDVMVGFAKRFGSLTQ